MTTLKQNGIRVVEFGRPRKLKNNKQMIDLIQERLDGLYEIRKVVKSTPISVDRDDKGKAIISYKDEIVEEVFLKKTPAITELQAFLGIESRSTWKLYKDGKYGKDFSNTVERITKRVEGMTEQLSLEGKLNSQIAKFTLENNYGWESKVVQETTGKEFEFNESDLSDD